MQFPHISTLKSQGKHEKEIISSIYMARVFGKSFAWSNLFPDCRRYCTGGDSMEINENEIDRKAKN